MAVAAAAALLAALATLTHMGPASATSSFSATAGADVFRVSVVQDPGILDNNLFDPGSATSQAELDSLGESTAFASDPYPGATFLSGPPTFAALFGTPSLDYPLLVSASHPARPTAAFDRGPIKLRADSAAARSASSAANAVGQSEAVVSYDAANDAVVAAGRADISKVDVGGQITFRSIHSTSSVTRTGAGTPVRKSSLEIGSITALGQSFALGPEGIESIGLPLPISTASGQFAAVLAALKERGITVRFLEPVVTDTGIISGAVQFVFETDASQARLGYLTTTYTVGRSVAAIDARPGRTRSVLREAVTPQVAEVETDFGADLSTSGDEVAVMSPHPVGEARRAARGQSRAVAVAALDRVSISSLYPLLALAAVGVVLLPILVRRNGRKASWIS